jgi:hypothetical protein
VLRRKAVIAVELADQLDHPVHSPEIALHHQGARNDHPFAEPGDLQLDEAGRRIDLPLVQHFRDNLSNATNREVLDARNVRHRKPGRQPLQNSEPTIRRPAPRRDAGQG